MVSFKVIITKNRIASNKNEKVFRNLENGVDAKKMEEYTENVEKYF